MKLSYFLIVFILSLAAQSQGKDQGVGFQTTDILSLLPQKKCELNPAYAKVIDNSEKKGATQLYINTFDSKTSVNSCLKTSLGVLKPGMMYLIQVRCKILKRQEDSDSNVTYEVRPYSGDKGVYPIDQTYSNVIEKWENIVLRFQVPDDISNASFKISVRGKVEAVIEDVILREGDFEKEVKVTNTIAPRELPDKLPTGADEFTIDLPRKTDGKVVSVSEFGASVESSDNTAAFNRAIAHCATVGASKLIVPQGTYRFTSDTPVLFEKLSDFEFDGQNSTFIFLKKKNNLIEINRGQRTLFKNFSIDWDWEKDPLASVGKVEYVEPTGEYADFRFIDYKSFPKKEIRIAAMDQMDPKYMVAGCENFFRMFFEFQAGKNPAKVEWKEPNLLRIYAENRKASFADNLKVGQLYRIKHYYYEMKGIQMTDNEHLTFSHVNIYSCPGAGFVAGIKQHHWQFLNTNIIRPPGTNRPITCTADHFYLGYSRGYIKMEGCEFSYGGDDATNIHDTTSFAQKTEEYTVRTVNFRGKAEPGDLFELRHDDYAPAEFTSRLKYIAPVNAEKRIYDMTFEDKIPEQKSSGFILLNREYGSQQVIIRNNYFHHCPRMILIANKLTLENNRFEHIMASPIKIETGYTYYSWSEGFGASNVVIRNNSFFNVNLIERYPNEKKPAIYISVYRKADPSSEKTNYPIVRDILIEGNSFNGTPGAVVAISGAQNVYFRNNTIANDVPRIKNEPYRGAIYASYAANLYITGNTWISSQYMPEPAIILDSETTKEVHSWKNILKK